MPAPPHFLPTDTDLISPAAINEKTTTPADYVSRGTELMDQGRLDAALDCYQKALRLDPNLAEAMYCTGNIWLLQRNPEQAAFWYKKTLGIRPDHVNALNHLGSAFNEMAQYDSARACFKRVVTLEPKFAEAQFNLALMFKNKGNYEAAIACYRQALQQNPLLVEAHYSLGIALQHQGRYQEAAASLQNAIHIAPDFAEAHYNLGLTFFNRSRLAEAEASYRKALEIKPDFPEAFNNLGLLFKDRNALSEATGCYQKALGLNPDMVEAQYNMGIALQMLGRYDEGRQYFAQALNINPEYAPARWLYLLSLPVLYRTADEIAVYRQKFKKNLDFLISHTPLDQADQQSRAMDGIASTTNFYLQYQGRNDRNLQIKYGNFVARVMAANYPAWAETRSMPLLAPGEKIRIGYVSSFMHAHTVGEFLLGWLKNHHRPEFEISCYHIGSQTDAMTPEFAKNCDHFNQVGPAIEPAAAKIVSDRLHVLVYTNIGMNAPATQLAGLRLAPVQCKGWGHPVTTGVPTIDFYLSSDLMEPADADNHYSEKLIRLPNLALAYQPPSLPANPKTRKDFGIRDRAFVYLTSQSLFKYLPQHDHVFAEIAARVPQAQLVFLSHSNGEITRQFQERLAGAFKSLNLRLEDFCLFLPRLNFNDFLSLNLASDVLLDTFFWSGGKTTLEGITCGLPVVTCPGRFMRGRHAYAMLKMMGVEDTITVDVDEYIERAARLGQDEEFYRAMRRRIEKNRHRIYNNTRCIQSLEDFYRSQATQAEITDPSLPGQEKNRNHNEGFDPRSFLVHADTPQPADARAFFARGGQLARSGRYEKAIANYQKALACIPDYLGIQPWFMEYLHDGSRPPSCSKDFVAFIYQALAACLYDTGRIEDALYAVQAAISMDHSNEKIYELKDRIQNDLPIRPTVLVGNIPRSGIPGRRYFSNPEKKLTVAMLTHFSRKLEANAELSPPGTGLVETTYASVLNVFGHRVAACPKLLHFDHLNSSNKDEAAYHQNLQKFAENHGFNLTVQHNYGLQKIVSDMLQRVTSPYLLFLEHDWEFQGLEIDIAALIDVFERYENINYVRFNKRNNLIAGFDFILEEESLVPDVDLIRTVAHSNNPFIVRVDKFRQEWLPACLNDPIYQQYDLRGQALGIEDPLFKRHIQDVRRLGFAGAHDLWGTYVFGKMGDPPRIVHLGE